MSFLVRPHRRFPVPCADTYHTSPFLPLPLAYFSGFWLLCPSPLKSIQILC
jgi:hypothetical protein